MRRGVTAPLVSGLLSDTGRQRSVNQDAGLAVESASGGLYAVADGMGGHAAGELAANLALDALSSTFLNGRKRPPERLAEAVQAANLEVMRHAVGEYAGMGTTLVALAIDRGAALLAHVGDSRAYLLRGNELTRLTEDHSWVAEQVRLGHLTEEEARDHQWRSVVSNALGGEERVRLELYGFPLRRGDRLMLCSDGLCGVVEEHDLCAMLGWGLPPDLTAQRLVDAANALGGPDNVTALVIDIGFQQPLPSYSLPLRQPDGPVYVDVLLSARRGSSPLMYLALGLVYFALMGALLFQRQSLLILLLAATLLLGLATWTARLKQARLQRALPDALKLTKAPAAPLDRHTLN
ncbi:serine/threonine protein phosphatase [Deinococcus irradiatisoli]|uniref:Serine/threonine protein phosphatase n=1 Tax=Deinococcus irradiatisoli TaxID=2202254 RepID=A0A2Z3JLD6_9DEIO|nr:protein phosphatase 2C domain-containing protein [Deinococcus irradiatisoli]AWN24716.1 serine/threonine protein phosphatase [Deinococcus irradiatisoli]